MDDLTYQCAVCGQAIDERQGDTRLIGTFVLPGREISMDEFFFHRSCLASVLHPTTPLGEVFEID
jgi:hypothetical protein